MAEDKNKTAIQNKLLETIPSNPHGLLLISPRFGKTSLTIKIIKRDNPKKILWVTPNTKLRDEDIPNEFKLWDAKEFLEKTDIICYSSMTKLEGEYDLVVLDEYQNVTSDNCRPFFNGKIKYKNILGLSGTHPKHEEKRLIFEKLNLIVKARYGINEAVDDNVIASYEITCIGVPLNMIDKNVKAGNDKVTFYQTEENAYNYHCRAIEEKKMSMGQAPMYMFLNRMKFIHNVKSKIDAAKKYIDSLKGRKLVFSSSIENSEKISKNTYNSKTNDENLNKFINGELDILSCVNAGGTGFTFKNVDHIVIVQVDSNQKGNTVQKIARGLVYQGKDYTSQIHIFYCKDTVDKYWVEKSLEEFDKSKIKWLEL